MIGLLELTDIEEFKHGDVIKVISFESNCGIDKGVFTAIVVNSAEDGLIAISQDFIGRIGRCVENGTAWEIEIEWLLDQDVEVYLLESYERFLRECGG